MLCLLCIVSSILQTLQQQLPLLLLGSVVAFHLLDVVCAVSQLQLLISGLQQQCYDFVQHDAFISSARSDRRDDASTPYAAEVQFIAASDITGMAPAAAGSQSTCRLLHCGASRQASGLRLLHYSTILFL